MSLSIGSSTKYKGVFVNKATVKSVVNLSHQPLPFIGKEFDLAIKATFDIGKPFDKEITIFGNFKRDGEDRVISLGSAFKVARFFNILGVTGELLPSNDLPAQWLGAVVGKEAFTLDYLVGVKENGKGKYYAWDMIDTDEDFLVNDFFKGVTKGFPKNFNPEALGVPHDALSHGDAYEGPSISANEAIDEMVF